MYNIYTLQHNSCEFILCNKTVFFKHITTNYVLNLNTYILQQNSLNFNLRINRREKWNCCNATCSSVISISTPFPEVWARPQKNLNLQIWAIWFDCFPTTHYVQFSHCILYPTGLMRYIAFYKYLALCLKVWSCLENVPQDILISYLSAFVSGWMYSSPKN